MPAQTLSIELPESVELPETLSHTALIYLLVDLLRSRGWIDDEDIEQLTGDSLSEFEQRLPGYKALKPLLREERPQSKWAALARSYRENPTMRGDSEEVNRLLREVRDQFAF